MPDLERPRGAHAKAEPADGALVKIARAISCTFSSWGEHLKNMWRRWFRGYCDKDVAEVGENMLAFIIGTLSASREHRGNADLPDDLSVLSTYVRWLQAPKMEVARAAGGSVLMSVHTGMQADFEKAWENIWQVLASTRPYDVSNEPSLSRKGTVHGRSLSYAWERSRVGFDDIQAANAALAIFDRWKVLLDLYAKDLDRTPSEYPSKSQLTKDKGKAWTLDCKAAGDAMGVMAQMLDKDDPVAAAFAEYGSDGSRDDVILACHKAWTWLGKNLPELWR